MADAPPFHVPLAALWLCPECDHAGNNPRRCACCANDHSLLNLATLLNREQPEEDRKIA